MYRLTLIFMATLPVLMFMAGCGGPNTNTTYNDISDDSSGNGGYQTVTVIDYAAIQKNNLEEMRRSKESMFRTIDQQFGIPPSRQDGHEHH